MSTASFDHIRARCLEFYDDGPDQDVSLCNDGFAEPAEGGFGEYALLGTTIYDPGTADAPTRNLTTFGDILTPELDVTFTTPATGNVYVDFGMTLDFDVDGNSGRAIELAIGPSGSQLDTQYLVEEAAQGDAIRYHSCVFYVSGLTPNVSVTWTPQWRITTVGNPVEALIGGNWGPGILMVWSAP